jgi:hypothetical protein
VKLASILGVTSPSLTHPRSTLTRLIPVALCALALCAALAVEATWARGGFLRLPLPIAGSNGFPIPIVSWAAIALYALVCGRLLHLAPSVQRSAGLRLGAALHLVVLLTAQIGDMARPHDFPLSVWYVRYWQALWTASLAVALALAWRVARQLRAGDPFHLPFVIGAAAFWAVSARQAPAVALIAPALAAAGSALAAFGRPFLQAARRLLQREAVFLGVVAVVALALRLFYLTRVMADPDYLNTGSDGPVYDSLAWSLVDGTTSPWSNVAFMAPGYVRFVALVYQVFGRSYAAVCIVQALISVAACWLMYDVAKRLFGVTAARVATVFGAVNFMMIHAAAAMGHQALDVFWTLLTVWALVCYAQNPVRFRWWTLPIGALLGWATVNREGNGIFWLFLLPWFVFGLRKRLGWMSLAHAALFSAGTLGVVLPFLMDGNGTLGDRFEHAWFYYPWTPAAAELKAMFNPFKHAPHEVVAMVLQQPGHLAWLLLKGMLGNFRAVFLNQDFGSFDLVFLLRRSTFYYGMWAYAYLLAFAGLGLVMWKGLRDGSARAAWWLIVLVLAARASVHLLFEAGYRHRVPMEPYLIMLAAYALDRLRGAMRRPSTAETVSGAGATGTASGVAAADA